MDTIGLVVDHFGQFTPKDVLNLALATLIAALLGTGLAAWGAGQSRSEARSFGLWAALAAAAVGVVKAQLPLAVALVALALLLPGEQADGRGRQVRGAALVIGLGCGSGASLVVLALFPLLLVLFRWSGRP